MLFGLFQNYDYWDSNLFELGTLGFGGGILHRLQIGKTSDLVTQLHVGIIPLAGLSSPYADIEDRNYNYSGGAEAMFEAAFNLGGWGNITAAYYIYGLHTYVGAYGNSIVGIFRPKIEVNMTELFSIGFEFLQYGKDQYLRDFPDVHSRNNEERIYFRLNSGYFRF